MIEAKAVEFETLRGVVMGYALVEAADGRLMWVRPDGRRVDAGSATASLPDDARGCVPGRLDAPV